MKKNEKTKMSINSELYTLLTYKDTRVKTINFLKTLDSNIEIDLKEEYDKDDFTMLTIMCEDNDESNNMISEPFNFNELVNIIVNNDFNLDQFLKIKNEFINLEMYFELLDKYVNLMKINGIGTEHNERDRQYSNCFHHKDCLSINLVGAYIFKPINYKMQDKEVYELLYIDYMSSIGSFNLQCSCDEYYETLDFIQNHLVKFYKFMSDRLKELESRVEINNK